MDGSSYTFTILAFRSTTPLVITVDFDEVKLQFSGADYMEGFIPG